MGQRRQYDQGNELDERIVDITRVAKVVKGGRRFAFRVAVVVGDNKGNVAVGVGKARSVPDAIRKSLEAARKNMQSVSIVGNTIPHQVMGRHGSAKVMLKPASPGTGVIAGGAARQVVEAAGYKDILSKSLGSQNTLNVLLATMDGLRQLKDVNQVAAERGKDVADVLPFWSR